MPVPFRIVPSATELARVDAFEPCRRELCGADVDVAAEDTRFAASRVEVATAEDAAEKALTRGQRRPEGGRLGEDELPGPIPLSLAGANHARGRSAGRVHEEGVSFTTEWSRGTGRLWSRTMIDDCKQGFVLADDELSLQ